MNQRESMSLWKFDWMVFDGMGFVRLDMSRLTLEHITKTLSRWMNKPERRDIEEESSFLLTEAMGFVFGVLKDLFQGVGEGTYKFEEVLKTYMGLFLSTGNNQHRYLIELHLKELLEPRSLEKYRSSRKYYEFLDKVFYYYPFLAFRLLQSRYQTIFSLEYDEVTRLYERYIKFANTRNNAKLLEEYIQKEISREHGSLDRLNILLTCYHNSYRKIIAEPTLQLILQIIHTRNEAWKLVQAETQKLKLLAFCETLFHITWPPSLTKYKARTMIEMIKIWETAATSSIKQRRAINRVLGWLEVGQQVVSELRLAIQKKVSQRSATAENFALNCEFAKIVLSKFNKEEAESVLTAADYEAMIDQIIASDYNREEQVELLQVLRAKGIHGLANKIQTQLSDIIRSRFSAEFGNLSDPAGLPQRRNNVIFALRILRIFNFQDYQQVQGLFRQLVLRSKANKQCPMQLRRQMLLVCLSGLRHRNFRGLDQQRRAFREIVELVGQQIELKVMMIQYIVDHLNERFYNQRQLYLVYKDSKHEYLLYEDYATNDMAVKIFSIKTICYLATHAHNQYAFFLKNAYCHIYDRLAIHSLTTPEDKETSLKIVREIMRHRAELFEGEADQLALLLMGELHKSIQFHSPQTNTISIYILKIFQALMKKIPNKMAGYCRSIAHYIINILNFKIIKKELKRIALQTLCELVDHCNYVLLPYFHFPNLYSIIREILRSDDHYYYYQAQLLRLIGRLGCINQEDFVGLQVLNSQNSRVDDNFEHIFGQGSFLRAIKVSGYAGGELRGLVVQDAFYSQQKVSSNCVEIENYRQYLLDMILRNVSIGCLEINLTKTLRTLLLLVPVLASVDHQQGLHQQIISILKKLFQIQSKFSNDVLNIVLELLRYHDLSQSSNLILSFYLPKMYNHRRQLQLVKVLCVLADRYPQCVDKQLVQIVIVVKRIILQNVTSKLCFSVVASLADRLDPELHLFFPDINRVFAPSEDPTRNLPEPTAAHFLTLLVTLAKKCPSLQYFLPSIRQCLAAQLASVAHIEQKRGFVYRIIDTMICLMLVYGGRCDSFIDCLQRTVREHNIYHGFYNICEEYFKKHSNLDYLHCAFNPQELSLLFARPLPTFTFDPAPQRSVPPPAKQRIIAQFQKLSAGHNLTQEQEDLWLDNLAVELFSNSGQEMLRACSELVSYDKVFSYDLFDVPFYFFWKSLTPPETAKLTLRLKQILLRSDISLRIRQRLLDSIYFLQRNGLPFLLKDKILSDVAVEVEDLVKAVFYLEREFQTDPETYRQALVYKYDEIGQQQSALGLMKGVVLQWRLRRLFVKLSMKLGIGEEVKRQGKEQIERERRDNNELLNIELKRDMFDWQSIYNSIGKEMVKPLAVRARFAHLAVEACLNLGKWEQANKWVGQLDGERSGEEASLWQTMLLLHERKEQEAEKLIAETRDKVYQKIRQMFNFSYEKSMKGVLLLQQVCQLEEILDFQKLERSKKEGIEGTQEVGARRKQLVGLWNDRLRGVRKNLYSMQKVLFMRSLLLTKAEDIDNWIAFCKLALRQNIKNLGRNILKLLLQLNVKDEVKKFELFFLQKQVELAEVVIRNDDAFTQVQTLIQQRKLTQDKRYHPLLFEIYYKYTLSIIEDDSFTAAKGSFIISTLRDFATIKEHYELSHVLGLTHIKMVDALAEDDKRKGRSERKQPEDNDLSMRKEKEDRASKEKRDHHILWALKCFLRSVTQSVREHRFFLEDCLKILNLISMGDETGELIKQMGRSYKDIPSEGLIEIIPQIIARLDSSIDQHQNYVPLMRDLLIYIGTNHPQALLFPLIFLRRGNNRFKKQLAEYIYDHICERSSGFTQLYAAGQLIVEELCKISLKLSQKVFIFMNRTLKALRDPSINLQLLSARIIAFCQQILQETQKLSSQSQFGFVQKERENLTRIIQLLRFFCELGEPFFFGQCHQLMRRLVDQTRQTLNFIRVIYLEEASVKLFKLRGSNVCLFGGYQPGGNSVSIESFNNEIKIIASKQRPKKLVVRGTDQKEYNYLLKGKQDLRLDERIMQLFAFVNKMFHSPSEKENYSIQGYSITPISSEIGIISWVENCDTIGDLILDYRLANGAPSRTESRYQIAHCLMESQSYSTLPKLQKVEIFRQVERRVSGDDLKHIFWKRAASSEKWLKSRACFTRSLAVMSIVGYIIGLGDRHPFNIMVQRGSGKIVHIDFGDCFQVNKMRKSFPEKVPFRLTRMLVNAMGACRTKGIFQMTCQRTMRTLRSHKESILVIVQAFRYDPLIGWKLTSKGDKGEMRLEHTDLEAIQASQGDDNDDERKRSDPRLNESESTSHILNNIKDKLHGKQNSDNSEKKPLQQAQQVERLIKQAISPENLVQHWEGWCIFW